MLGYDLRSSNVATARDDDFSFPEAVLVRKGRIKKPEDAARVRVRGQGRAKKDPKGAGKKTDGTAAVL